MKKTVCKQCGSEDVTVTVVVNPNNVTPIAGYCRNDETITEDGWCNRCGDYVELETVGDEQPVDPWRCGVCGSLNVEMKMWVDSNDLKITSQDSVDRNECWCRDCEEHTNQIQQSELMETVEKWFANHLCPDDDEVISGLVRNDFDSDEEFNAACKQKWDARDVEGKIDIWRKSTCDKSNE
jgi:hypothetical protein